MAGGAAPAVPLAITGAELKRSQFLFAYALVTSLFFLWGFSYGLIDVLNKHFQNIFEITRLKSTMLQVVYFGSYLLFSPFSATFMKRVGYKAGIYLGLLLFAIGAACFWPCAKFASYGGFLGATFVTGCGLSTLEVAANSYVSVLGNPKFAALRLTLSQSFNGVGTIAAPAIASRYFFADEHSNDLTTVQWVYLAVALFALTLMVLFWFCYLPEIREEVAVEKVNYRNFFRQYHTIFGACAQWMYTGAQVGVASLAVNYYTELPGAAVSDSQASLLFSYSQTAFTVGRFIAVPFLSYFEPSVVLLVHGAGCIIFSILASTVKGVGGMVCLFFVFYFESCVFPVIFAIATKDLGAMAKIGSAAIAMGVSGGAAFPPAQGALADARSTQLSYLVPMIGFVAVTMYATGMWISTCRRTGWRVRQLPTNALATRAPDGHLNKDAVAHDRVDDVEVGSRTPREEAEKLDVDKGKEDLWVERARL